MATTNLIVDFLVIGLVSFIWLGPIAVLVLGAKSIKDVLDVGIMIIPLALGFAYILGISISRFADDITDRWNDKWRDEIFGANAQPSYHSQLNLVIAKSESASEYLGYRRSVIRTARACAVNFILGSLLWLALSFFKPELVPWNVSLLVSLPALIFSALLFRAWKVVLCGYFYGIRDLYTVLQVDAQDHPSRKADDNGPTQ